MTQTTFVQFNVLPQQRQANKEQSGSDGHREGGKRRKAGLKMLFNETDEPEFITHPDVLNGF